MARKDNDWGRYTPVDSTGFYVFSKSAYKNIRFNVPASSTFQVKDHDAANLPGIAFKVYGDTSMWHILMSYNGLEDAIQDVYAGLVLRVPDKAAVISYLSKQVANSPVILNL